MKLSGKDVLFLCSSTYCGTMKTAEHTMEPVLKIFHDNVLFLKHNLNAQAIGSLQNEFTNPEGRIEMLIQSMSVAIASSNKFIADLK